MNVRILKRLRTQWRQMIGEDETALSGDVQAWGASLVFHIVLLVSVAVISIYPNQEQITLTLRTPVTTLEEEPELAPEFHFASLPQEDIGALSMHGSEMALAAAPTLSDVALIPRPQSELFEVGHTLSDETIEIASAPNFDKMQRVKGRAGVGTTGAAGAIDRITHEILLSLEERKTLVVWLFDQSGSLARQREAIHNRFDRIYEELGIIEAAGGNAFKKHADTPLLTSVIAFGRDVSFRTPKPTSNLEQIKLAVSDIELDDSGIERVFVAVRTAAQRFRTLRKTNPKTGEPSRNVLLVVVTDEAGDDVERLDPTVDFCRRVEMPVFVVGVPAPFGRDETLVKWVDPDPRFDQTPQWGRVSQGPESLRPERIKIHFGGYREDTAAIDSGFGPFALTRLCYETGGIYFAVHPNRRVGRGVSRRETADFSAHFQHFFDPTTMRKYRPDYVSAGEYMSRLKENRARAALVRAAEMSWLTPLESPRTRFVKTDEASLVGALTEAQKSAAKLEPSIESLYQVIKLGESDREKETTYRWQAGYDLAAGRVLAVKVRTQSYNAMLAMGKRGMKFENDKNNTWVLQPASQIDVGSQLQKQADKASFYLQRVVDDHPDTPWALLAQRELRQPLGWRWNETSTDLDPRPQGNGGNNNNPAPRDDRRRMLPKPKPKRPVPRL